MSQSEILLHFLQAEKYAVLIEVRPGADDDGC